MTYCQILLFTRSLRKNQTPTEIAFWDKVRRKQFLGLKFNRQFIIQHSNIIGKKSYFITDFYNHEKRAIIEIDGKIHLEQKEYDEIREDILREMKYHIIRFTNEEVLGNWEGFKNQFPPFPFKGRE